MSARPRSSSPSSGRPEREEGGSQRPRDMGAGRVAMEKLVLESSVDVDRVELPCRGLGVSSDGPAQPRGAISFTCSHSEGECIQP